MQQISDCVTGVAHLQGRSLELDEPVVVPLLPNSDYQTGLVALNYCNLFLFSPANDPAEIQDDLRRTYAASLHCATATTSPASSARPCAASAPTPPQLFRSDYSRAACPRGWVAPKARPSRSWGWWPGFQTTQLKDDAGPCFLGAGEARGP